ncbi:uncharacterized protein LOC124931243 [Impatiens glandulifera]|uniref:uncharacterized protein LOC124931243 n=1 Tax=Impatiens glandulifera TaxID=253017 RepID=UPI001FB0CEF0|nr:uncharacterized protein LOC124931243 [Impatiens glandulifera]
MRFFRKIAGLLGFSKDESHDVNDEDDDDDGTNYNNRVETHLPRKGFSVPVQVAVDRPQVVPLFIPCRVGDGGLQGLKWYAQQLKIDEDGDIADEFFEEIVTNTGDHQEQDHSMARFEVKYVVRPAKVRNQALSLNGKIQHSVDFQGRVEWV